MIGLCECGCRQPAPIATKNDRYHGWVKGQPHRYINGHRGNPEPGDNTALRIRNGHIDRRNGRPPKSEHPDYTAGYYDRPPVWPEDVDRADTSPIAVAYRHGYHQAGHR